MFVAIVGTRFSGKSVIENYLVSCKGFTSVRIVQSDMDINIGGSEERFEALKTTNGLLRGIPSSLRLSLKPETDVPSKHLSFLSMSPLPSPAPTSTSSYSRQQQTRCFSSTEELLIFVTENWRQHFVTTDLNTRDIIEPFIRRPFFLLLRVDAPLLERYARSRRSMNMTLTDFVEEDDRLVFGVRQIPTSRQAALQNLADLTFMHTLTVSIYCILNIYGPAGTPISWRVYGGNVMTYETV
ncbi:unnamed protein product [Cyclocybe aegerita]|uniref:Uncharacterized protein n=1 Tax=Cyclocybe aegerita TaxID=1973307 RepID=A0A8S0VX80_CYCAE|nr:unnamed protein product [Cyclocybe aegerita]